jgi:menaquinone-dependent protoporphyrinogen IX oxidase
MHNPPRILIVSFSRTGTTERLADLLAARLLADCEALREREGPQWRSGVRGYLRSLADSIGQRHANPLPTAHDPTQYDVVVVGTPVWASCAAAPVTTWLAGHRGHLRKVAFFCSLGGYGSDKAFEQMHTSAGVTPLATCAIRAADLRAGRDQRLLDAFARKIRDRAAVLESLEWSL